MYNKYVKQLTSLPKVDWNVCSYGVIAFKVNGSSNLDIGTTSFNLSIVS